MTVGKVHEYFDYIAVGDGVNDMQVTASLAPPEPTIFCCRIITYLLKFLQNRASASHTKSSTLC